MDLKNIYYYFNKEIPKSTCDEIIAHGLKKISAMKSKGLDTSGFINDEQVLRKGGSTTFANKTFEDLSKENPNYDKKTLKYRDSDVTWLKDQYLYDMLSPLLETANEKSGWKFDYDLAEDIQFTVYKPGGYYNWHSDGGSCNFSVANENTTTTQNHWGKVRKISMTLNLSDPKDYEGGDLIIDFGPHSDKERFNHIKEFKEQGSIVFFPSFTRHQVTPVTKGTRISLAYFIHGPKSN